MKITKLEHACLDITDDNSRLVIDPGHWTNPLKDYSGIAALVVTHVHPDHFDETKIHKIAEQNPSLQIFCTQQVADKLSQELKPTVPNVGAQYEVGSLILEFFGGLHAAIMNGMPQDQNFGVLVNDKLYYPGDSFTPCPKPHVVLAVPGSAPWLKIGEATEFIMQDSAQQLFPTHNNIVNDNGQGLIDYLLGSVAKKMDKNYRFLKPGESIEV